MNIVYKKKLYAVGVSLKTKVKAKISIDIFVENER